MLAQLGDEWRPDKSEILIKIDDNDLIPEGYSPPSIKFDLVGSLKVVMQESFVGYVAALINKGVPTFISVPGKPGHVAGRTFLNDGMASAVASRDFLRLVNELVNAVECCVNHPKEKICLD